MPSVRIQAVAVLITRIMRLADAVKGGAISRQFFPTVEKGVLQAMESEPVAGFPMQQLRL